VLEEIDRLAGGLYVATPPIAKGEPVGHVAERAGGSGHQK
jgi:hypothetical protein